MCYPTKKFETVDLYNPEKIDRLNICFHCSDLLSMILKIVLKEKFQSLLKMDTIWYMNMIQIAKNLTRITKQQEN